MGNRSLPSPFLCHCEPVFGEAIPKLHDRGLLRAAALAMTHRGVNGYKDECSTGSLAKEKPVLHIAAKGLSPTRLLQGIIMR